eukprot:TRINITY_DN1832_c0_g1_i1.p1 TRINITY_DN1832_c0_g1~~TRINITY_DN1832_c0_g1_i1.p1  ORF type:complete len:561 (+),score=88.40 TRINITY_DN1832_c0_g1_i1:129-1811(+)
MIRLVAVFVLLLYIAILNVTAQPPKPNGRGSEFIKPLPPAKDPSTPGVAEECATVAIRNITGRCTSAVNPALGEARRAQFSYFDVSSEVPLGADLPSPRLISNIVSEQEGDTFNSFGLNEIFIFFGQFIDHDFALTPFQGGVEFNIEVPEDDPILKKSSLQFIRSNREAVNDSTLVERPITLLSSALDLSTVYGVDEVRNEFLRVPDSCRLKTSNDNLLPFNTGGLVNSPDISPKFFIGGDTRVSETPMLTVMHTIWVREHNRLCDLIEAEFSNFTPEQQYETARAINIAEYQKIVYEEWLPAILGSITLSPFTGYDPSVDPTISLEFTTAAFRLGHTLIGTDVTRIDESGNTLAPLPAENMFFLPSQFFSDNELEDFIRGGSATLAQEFDAKTVDILRNFLFENVEDEEGFDLIALNLQRGRDHNVAKFNELREFFLGSRASSFSDISSDPETASKLEEAYGNVDDVEAWIGLMAEDKFNGSGVGPTLGALLVEEFTRLRDGDQFFFLLRNQIPEVVFDAFPEIEADLFTGNTLFNTILLRTTSISSSFLPSGKNAFKA